MIPTCRRLSNASSSPSLLRHCPELKRCQWWLYLRSMRRPTTTRASKGYFSKWRNTKRRFLVPASAPCLGLLQTHRVLTRRRFRLECYTACSTTWATRKFLPPSPGSRSHAYRPCGMGYLQFSSRDCLRGAQDRTGPVVFSCQSCMGCTTGSTSIMGLSFGNN